LADAQKIRADARNAGHAAPDFAMLRAALWAAQASTPTAIAGRPAPAAPDPAEVLARLFGDGHSDPQQQRALHGSFNPAASPDGLERER